MHSAPSVSYPVGRSRFAGALLLCAWLLGAVACLSWRLASPASGLRSSAAAAALVLAAGIAAWHWWRTPAGTLCWDQEQWSWRGAHMAAGTAPQVGLDLQHWMLLRWRYGRLSSWLWLERASRPGQWSDLRRAVYSRARPEAPPAVRPPAAKS
jgi:toxin CptA